MAYCYECGEQVAENDVYCPFCGISLPPAVADDVKDDAQPESVHAQPIEAATDEMSAAVIDEKTDDISTDVTAESYDIKIDSIEIPPSVIENAEENKNVEHAVEFPSENKNEAVDSEMDSTLSAESQQTFPDAPAPKILERLSPLVETPQAVVGEMKTVETPFEASAVKPVEETNLDPVFVSTEGETLEAEESAQTESSMMSYEEAEVKEIPSATEPEKSADELSAKIEAQPSEFKPSGFDVKMNFIAEPATAADAMKTPEVSTAPNDFAPSVDAPIVEQPIAMPPINLPVAENNSQSRFDSVSIMEKAFEEEKPVEAESPIQENETPAVAGTPIVQNEERSATQQNIGGKDTDDRKKAKLKPLDEGTVLNGRYEIVRKIGGGGMGAVYLASDKNLGGVLRAVKEMVQSYIEDAQQEKAVNDFKRESLLLTSLDHQSIPTIYDYFYDEKEARFYLVMKYISGGDLSGRLRSAPEGRIDETNVTLWAIQVADVLDYLHNRQPAIIYRDLKPANVMIDGNSGRVMLIDFGIARWVNKEEKGVTAVGTMGYAPPELFSGNVEARSDIYSLGSTMFHLLTGADPQSNPLLIFDFQKHPRPRQINPQLSDQMERILMRAVEYSADKRFASAAELRGQLEEHLANLKAGRVTFGVAEAPASIPLSDQPVFCGFCGQKIVATDMFCAFCGAKQPLAQQGVHSESYAPAPLTAQLLVIGTNPLEQPAFRLEKEDNLVGRRDPQSNIFPEVDLSKYDPQTKISRRHARIWREGSEYMVEDLGSSNGTFILPIVNDAVRLQPRQPQALTNGDKLRLGDTTLHFLLG